VHADPALRGAAVHAPRSIEVDRCAGRQDAEDSCGQVSKPESGIPVGISGWPYAFRSTWRSSKSPQWNTQSAV